MGPLVICTLKPLTHIHTHGAHISYTTTHILHSTPRRHSVLLPFPVLSTVIPLCCSTLARHTRVCFWRQGGARGCETRGNICSILTCGHLPTSLSHPSFICELVRYRIVDITSPVE